MEYWQLGGNSIISSEHLVTTLFFFVFYDGFCTGEIRLLFGLDCFLVIASGFWMVN
jgi:hypothetical protein